MIQEKDQLIRLDWVLHFLAKQAIQGLTKSQTWERLTVEHPTIHLPNNESAQWQLFDKLYDDGYIKEINGSYWITLNGIIFSDNGKGGYIKDVCRKRCRRQYETTRDILLIVAGILAGLGTVCLFFVELAKHFWWTSTPLSYYIVC